MSQYFENDSKVESKLFTYLYYFNNTRFEIYSDNGVFSKSGLDFGSKCLLDYTINSIKEGKCLDLGCGLGVIGLTLSYFNNLDFDYADVNERATILTKKNIEKYHLKGDVFLSDGFNEIKEKVYDHILLNPPIRAGKKVIYSLFEQAFYHLKNGGDLTIVIQKKQGALSALKYLETVYQNVEICTKNKGYFIIKSTKFI